MDPITVGILGLVAFFVLLFLGVHVGVAMGSVGVVGLWQLLGTDATVSTVASGSFFFLTSTDFIVLPVFVLMGLVAVAGGLTDRTFEGLRRFLTGVRGGTGLATIAGASAFGTIAGTSIITAMVFGKVGSPAMRKQGYDKRLAYGVASASGILGVLLPPSSFAVFYGLLTQESIAKLLLAGIGPGVVLALLYAAMFMFIITIRPHLAPRETGKISVLGRLHGLTMTWELLLAFAIIMGGIFSGVFTVTESASVGAAVIAVMAIIRSRGDWRSMWLAVMESVNAMGMLFLLLAAAKVFSKFVTVSGITQEVVDRIVSVSPGPKVFLLLCMVMFMVLGLFLETLSILILTVPILYPVVGLLGIEPMWFFAVVVLSIEMGLLHPPLGMNIFAVKAVAEKDVTLGDIQWGTLPFASMVILTTVLVIFIPDIASWIPLRM